MSILLATQAVQVAQDLVALAALVGPPKLELLAQVLVAAAVLYWACSDQAWMRWLLMV